MDTCYHCSSLCESNNTEEPSTCSSLCQLRYERHVGYFYDGGNREYETRYHKLSPWQYNMIPAVKLFRKERLFYLLRKKCKVDNMIQLIIEFIM